jgi:rare lipoprotein A (peptidoglycan hydrolase)
MKPFIAALMFSLFLASPGFAQTQTGNASYNTSKNGLTLAHSSMSFGTRVRITNLGNNSEVIAIVDGRIPVGDPRIADVSAEAGNVIGMATSGYTQVRLEQLVPLQAPAPVPVETAANPPAAAAVPRQPAAPAAANPPAPPAQESLIVESIEVVTPQPQYLAYPVAAQNYCSPSLCVVILVLLIIAVMLLTAILVLLVSMRRLPWWPWFYPLWARRRMRYLKNRRV